MRSSFGSKELIGTPNVTFRAVAKLLHAGTLAEAWFNTCCTKQACEITQVIIHLCGNKLDQNGKGHCNKPIPKSDGAASLQH